VEGEPVRFPFRKLEALTYLLVLEGSLGRERLATLLWGEREEATARRNLRNALYLLARLLPEGALLVDRRAVRFDPSLELTRDWDDLERIPSLPGEELPRLGRPLLEEFALEDAPAFEEWLLARREEADRLYVSGLRCRAAESARRGRRSEAIAEYETLMERDPVDEESARALLRLYRGAGRTGAAAALFGRLKEALAELGVEPDPQTNLLFDAIRESGGSAPAEEAVPVGTNPFVRGREREALESFLTAALDGTREPRAGLILGEEGSGKTHLASEVARLAAGEGLVLSGRCVAGEESYSFVPWREIVATLAARVDLERLSLSPLHLRYLRVCFPFLSSGEEGDSPGVLSLPDVNPSLLGRILAAIFRNLADRSPLLVMEDFQWADSGTLAVLQSLLEELPDGLRLLCTAFQESRPRVGIALAPLEERGRLLVVELPRFSREQVERILKASLSARFSPEEVDRAFVETEGNAFFLAEWIQALREGGIPGAGPRSAGFLNRRLAVLPEEERRLLDLLAVFPGDVPYDLLTEAAGVSRMDLADRLERLAEKEILSERLAPDGALFIAFRHVRMKEHIRGAASEARRRALHDGLTDLLLERVRSSPWDRRLLSMLADQARSAGRPMDELGARIADLRLHFHRTHELFPLCRDADLRGSSPSPVDARTTETAFDVTERLLERLSESAPPEELRVSRGIFYTLKGGYLLWRGEYDAVPALLQEGMRAALASGDRDAVIEGLEQWCYLGIQTENPAILERTANALYRESQIEHRHPQLGTAFRFLGLWRMLRGEFQIARRCLEMSIRLFEKLEAGGSGYTLSVVAALNYLGDIDHWRGDSARALRQYRECVVICEAKGIYRGLDLFHSNACHAAMDVGDRKAAWHHCRQLNALSEQLGAGWGTCLAGALRGLLLAEEGRLEAAARDLILADEACRQFAKPYWQAVMESARAQTRRIVERVLARAEGDTVKVAPSSGREEPGGDPVREARTALRLLPEPARVYAVRARDIYRGLNIAHEVSRMEALIAEEVPSARP
jgi:DNA-binding SARP family transcriptional activator